MSRAFASLARRCSVIVAHLPPPWNTKKVRICPLQSQFDHLSSVYEVANLSFSGETIICVLDFKRDVGLWHAVMTVRNFWIRILNDCKLLLFLECVQWNASDICSLLTDEDQPCVLDAHGHTLQR